MQSCFIEFYFFARGFIVPIKNLIIALAFLLPTASFAFSADRDQTTDMIAMSVDYGLAELLAILQEETEIATKSKMNADYVPGIVTVLHGDDLEAMGVRTVWEALGFVPGIDATIDNFGRPLALVRGIGYMRSGHLRIMLDSVLVNLTFSGSNDPFMLIPIEQVERIDIIRGPGSALYGEFSYAGVVNIITRKEGNRMYGRAGSFSTWGGGGLFSYADPSGDLKLSLNFAGWQSDVEVDSGPDANITSFGRPEISLSPGPTNEDEEVSSIGSSISYKKFSLSLYRVQRSFGQYFGIPALNPDDGKTKEDGQFFVEAKQEVEISPSIEASFNLRLSEGGQEEERHMVVPPGGILGPDGILLPDGLWIGGETRERRVEGGADLKWTGWKNHEWLLRLSLANVEITDAWAKSNVDPGTGTVFSFMQLLPDNPDNLLKAGLKRQIFSVALQDQFQATESFSITAGVRFDDFDDIGQSVTPRIAGVLRVGEPHIIKLQYAQAFRPPNFFELYLPPSGAGRVGNPDLESETMETYEAGYIYRETGVVGRATIFYSKLKNMISEDVSNPHDRRPKNIGEILLQGVELELEKEVSQNWKVAANLSYVDAQDETNDAKIGNSAGLLVNLTVKGRVMDDLLVSARYLHVGERNRAFNDDRDKLEGYDTIDLTISRFNLLMEGLTLRAGVKNVFDAEVKASSMGGTYIEDLPRPGSTWWAQVSKNF
jgi:iron complex outermembrane receptor protein